jgi:hypothetical protein
MTPESFIAKWRANTRNERAACHEHFIDLCHLLDEPTPNSDPDGANYAFEKGATKATGGDGWADVWRRECFAWEYKGKHRDLEAAHRQLNVAIPDLLWECRHSERCTVQSRRRKPR